MTRTDLREYITQLLTPGVTPSREEVENMGVEAARSAITGAFLTAIERRFQNPPSREEVTAFVTRVRRDYIKADQLPPMMAEALVRAAARGEESLVSGMSESELNRGQIILTYGLVHDLGLTGSDYEQFLTEATEYAEEILRDRTEAG